jgi:hypothetical protein
MTKSHFENISLKVNIQIKSLEYDKKRNIIIIGCKKPKFVANVLDNVYGTSISHGLMGIDGFYVDYEETWKKIQFAFVGMPLIII